MTKPKKRTEIAVAKFSSFTIEGWTRGTDFSLRVGGVHDVLDYTDGEIRLKTGRGILTVSGKRLTLVLYENRAVEIGGFWEVIRLDAARIS